MEFQGFPKMARLSRNIIVTEKIDGSNAQVFIDEDGNIKAGSRTRWITPKDDNFGFAAWVEDNKTELLKLGPGRHFGEWWGKGIQRNYGLQERRFSLFNVSRWEDDAVRPACCHVVPVLLQYTFDTEAIERVMQALKEHGSAAAPGFSSPEGIIVWHTAANIGFKKTLVDDAKPKSLCA
jgi:hypothetical protein